MTDRSPTARVFNLNSRAGVDEPTTRSTSFDRRAADGYHGCPRELTAREHEVLAMLCEGLPNKLIARRLNIGTGTVKCHVGSILVKLGAASRLGAVVEAYRRGLVDAARGRPIADPMAQVQ